MRRTLPLLVLTAVLSACGAQTHAVRTTQATAAPDPGRALGALIDAAQRGDDAALEVLLLPDGKASSSELEDGLGRFARARPRTLYRGGDWAVAFVTGTRTAEGTRERGAYAVALRLVDGRWRADLTGRVGVEILGPQPGARAGIRPQLGVELRSSVPLRESGLWLDGRELLAKGGGSPTRGTIYGAPDRPVARGPHVAVAYARAGAHGTAVAWVFRV